MPDTASGSSSLHLVGLAASLVEELDLEECFRRLADGSVGRVVYTDGALPAITPVRYAVEGGLVYFRPHPDPRLLKAITGAVVAFEADQLHEELRAGWSVVVTGVAEACTRPSEWPRVASLNLAPPHDVLEHVFVLSPGIITGRRIRADGAAPG